MDFEGAISSNMKGKYSHIECVPCGKKSVVGNIGQRLREGWPRHCGHRMVLVRRGERIARNPDGSWQSVPTEEKTA